MPVKKKAKKKVAAKKKPTSKPKSPTTEKPKPAPEVIVLISQYDMTMAANLHRLASGGVTGYVSSAYPELDATLKWAYEKLKETGVYPK